MHRKILCTFCAILTSLAAHAGTTVSVPNTFVAGTPAKAADVNANFAALVNGINSLVAPPTVVDSAGHVVGPYIFASGSGFAGGGGATVEGVFLRTSAASFVVPFNNQGFEAPSGSPAYTTSDCTGTAYYDLGNLGVPKTLFDYAFVVNTTAYVFHLSAATSVSIGSVLNVNGCGQTSYMTLAAPAVATVDLSTLGFVPPFSVR